MNPEPSPSPASNEDLQKELRQLQAVYRMSDVVARAGDLAAINEAAIAALMDSLPITRASILLFDPDGVMRFKASRGLSEKYRSAVEGHTPWKPNQKDARPFAVRDVAVDADLAAFRETIMDEGIRALAFIPLSGTQGVAGKFMLYCDEPHDFTPDEIRLAETIANHIGFVIERRRTEMELRASQREFQDVVDNAPVGIHWLGPDGTILWANRAELELLGYSEEEYIGHHVGEFHVDPAIVEEIMSRLREHRHELHSYEAPMRCRDGSIRHVLISTNVFADGDRFIHKRCFTRDITDRKLMEEELENLLQREQESRRHVERVNRLKDEFLATLSHELRTPLQAMLGWSRLLLSERLEPHQVQRAAEIIERNASVQARLIDDLLDMSRIISGKVSLNLAPVDMADVIISALETVRPAAEAREIDLRTVLRPNCPVIIGDQERLHQVVWNLLMNAIKFTPRGGTVIAWLNATADGLEMAIQDSGEGIAAEFLPFVFERFLQGDASTTRRQGGLGLGLAIVRNLVEHHGGRVSAESPGVGLGATFRVVLPVPARAPALTHSRPAVSRAGNGNRDGARNLNGVRVLLVEDDPDARELVRFILEDSGAGVLAAESVPEAFRLLREARPDVVLSDIAMPGEDGYELIRRLRALPEEEGGNLPAIALTALARGEDRSRILASGFQAHLAKPVEPADLIRTIGRLSGPALTKS
jgi:PAS domain S-box-containing protein